MHVDHCPRHGDVDAILATGAYTDRKGRAWMRNVIEWWTDMTRPWRSIPSDQMRLKIIRERHRDECPRLSGCQKHPVPSVAVFGKTWLTKHRGASSAHPTFGAALDAARHMTGATP